VGERFLFLLFEGFFMLEGEIVKKFIREVFGGLELEL
jgi:hypothetical protein